jgi:hypothetical protein
MTYTRTFAIMEVSQAVYDEIKAKLEAAGYEDAVHTSGDGVVLDLHGIALALEPVEPRRQLNYRDERGVHEFSE